MGEIFSGNCILVLGGSANPKTLQSHICNITMISPLWIGAQFVSTAMPDSSWLAMLASPQLCWSNPQVCCSNTLFCCPNSLCCCSIPKFCYQNVFFVAKPNCFVAKFPGVLSFQSSFGHVQMSRDWIQAFLIVAIPCHTWCLIPFGKWGLWPGSFL